MSVILPHEAIRKLSKNLGYEFQNLELLHVALTHSSWCAENRDAVSNERLEFLGDAVLGMAVARLIYDGYPTLSEGQLTQLRATVISSSSLSRLAENLGVGPSLRLGKGQVPIDKIMPPSILEDAMEAIIGAVYLDGGQDAAAKLILELLGEQIEENSKRNNEDFKSRLQSLAGQEYATTPEYEIESEGPAHAQRFFVKVSINNRVLGYGEGRSKKEAEQFAAGEALRILLDEEDDNKNGMMR